MINTNLVLFSSNAKKASLTYNFGQTILDSTPEPDKLETQQPNDPDENQIVEAYEGDCEQCEIEKIHKACTICEE